MPPASSRAYDAAVEVEADPVLEPLPEAVAAPVQWVAQRRLAYRRGDIDRLGRDRDARVEELEAGDLVDALLVGAGGLALDGLAGLEEQLELELVAAEAGACRVGVGEADVLVLVGQLAGRVERCVERVGDGVSSRRDRQVVHVVDDELGRAVEERLARAAAG